MIARCIEQDHGELLAAVAGRQVERAARKARENAGDRLHDLVARLVAVAVVVFLEMIDIREQERQRLVFAHALVPHPLQVFVEAPAIVDAGQAVLQRRLRQHARVEPGAAACTLLSLAAKAFRGQTKEFSFGTAFAFTEQGSFGEVYRYKFSTAEIKTPLQDAVTKAGWAWRGVSFGKL